MAKRIQFKQWQKKLTPSGYWDNHLYVHTDDIVSFPKEVLEQAIISEVQIKVKDIGRMYKGEYQKAWKVNYNNSTWIVDKDPLGV